MNSIVTDKVHKKTDRGLLIEVKFPGNKMPGRHNNNMVFFSSIYTFIILYYKMIIRGLKTLCFTVSGK